MPSRKVLADVRQRGVGHNYLIEHSAGSASRTPSRGWPTGSRRLHDPKDKPIFSSVIVITDRLVLDKQLQDTIYQFEHKQGVVAEDRRATRLSSAAALEAGTPIIISTLQKFSFMPDKRRSEGGAALRRHRGRGSLLADGRERPRSSRRCSASSGTG